ncbi:MAG: class I SAM-dependent methyltransferase [Proteobacteria bacterium]|nr:class I SAM-dependent methyltransferase [Pseudomonadota bacterium]
MDPSYKARYEYLYRMHWWWRARESILLKELGALCAQMVSRPSILDIGCGNGLLFGQLAKYGRPEGIEVDESLVSQSPKLGPIYTTPFEEWEAPHSYDLILMLDVLEHVEDDLEFLRKARSILANNGRLLITVPAGPELFTSHDRINHHLRRYRRAQLLSVLEKSGFTVERVRYIFVWTAVVKLLIRGMEYLTGRDIAGDAVPTPFINSLLTRLTILESLLLAPVGFPWGSSLLCIARE